MLSKSPSWVVAVIGAFIVITATAMSSTLLYQTRESIRRARLEIADARGRRDRLWSSHRQGDRRSTAADIFLAEAFGEGSNTSFLLSQTGHQLRGAILAMWAASGETVPDEFPEELKALEAKLLKGDLSGYKNLKARINGLRLLSQEYVNRLSTRIDSEELRAEFLESRESSIYLAYVFFNLMGLIVTTCKDLPVWKDE